jgi:hypothetical protein
MVRFAGRDFSDEKLGIFSPSLAEFASARWSDSSPRTDDAPGDRKTAF